MIIYSEFLKTMIQMSEFLIELKAKLDTLKKESSQEEKLEAQNFLTKFQDQTDNLTHLLDLLNSHEENLFFFGLQTLDHIIDHNWETLSTPEKNFFLNFIFQNIYDNAHSDYKLSLTLFYPKRIQCLIKIIFKFGTREIFIFLENIIEQAKLSEFICEINVPVLNIFLEELLLKNNLELKKTIQSEHQFLPFLKKIEQLCHYILEKTHLLIKQRSGLLIASLNCLESVIKLSNFLYCFEDKLFILLIVLCPNKVTMNSSLNCLLELALSDNPNADQMIRKIFMNFVVQFNELMPFTYHIGEVYKIFNEENRQFILNTMLFLNLVFKKKITSNNLENLCLTSFSISNQVVVKLSCIPSIEIYKICLNWWLFIIEKNFILNDHFPLYNIFRKIFFDLRIIVICRMAKPEEVLMREDETGQIIKEKVYDTESDNIYRKSKKVLLFLANLDKKTTREIILEKLSQQFLPFKWSRRILNSLCWTIGTISSVFVPKNEDSKIFFITTLKNLLQLCEIKKKKKNKAIIASNIMFIVGQYPEFLKNHWKFCKTVIEKLFEFISEPMDIPGFKDMVVDTFFLIIKNCGEYIAKDFYFERRPFIRWIFDSYSRVKKILQLRHKRQFLISIASLVIFIPVENDREYFISKISSDLNQEWICFSSNIEIYISENSVSYLNNLSFWLRTNIKILNILKSLYFDDFEYISKNFYFLIYFMSNKASKTIEKKASNYFNFNRKQIEFVFIKNFFDMLLKLIDVLYQKKNSNEFDKNCFNLLSPIFSSYREKKMEMFFNELDLAFTLYLLKEIDFYSSLNSLEMLIRKTIIFRLEQQFFTPENLIRTKHEMIQIVSVLIVNQFPCLLSLSSDPKIAEETFEIIMSLVGEGIITQEKSINEASIKILIILLERIPNTNLENYFFLNYSMIFISKLIINSFYTISSRSKNLIVKSILTFIKMLRCRLSFDLFSVGLKKIFLESKIFSNETEVSEFIFLLYTNENISLIEERVKKCLHLSSSTKPSSDSFFSD